MNERAPVREPAAARARGATRPAHHAPEHLGVLDLHATAGNHAVATVLASGHGGLPERVDPESLGSLLPRLEQRAPHRATAVAAPLRTRLEAALGTTVDDVAVHTDPEAASLADRSGAQAVTVGRHVLVGPGRYAPHTPEGQSLLAHEVVHAVAQRSAPTGSRGTADPAEEQAVGRAGGLAAAGIRTPVPRATSAVGHQGKDQPAPAVAKLYSYKTPDGSTVQVTEQAYLAQRAQAAARLRGDQRQILDYAGVYRGTHQRYLDENSAESFADIAAKPSRLFGIAVNIRAGVVPPVISIWDPPVRLGNDAAAALAAGDLDRAARLTGRAREALTSAQRQWDSFIGRSIKKGEELADELETVRDVSFAIAIAAAAVLLAPVVAGAVGTTGVAATGLTALGTGALTGAGGFVLRGGAEVGGQAITGKVDLKKAAKTAAKHVPADVATGLTAGAAPGLGQAAGLAKPGLGVASTLARNAAVHGGLAAATGVAETGLDTARAVALEGKTLEQATKENVVPGLERTGVGVAGAVLSSPLGPAGQGLAARGRPLLGTALSHTGGAVVAGGTTLATGGTTKEAANAALRAGIVSTALGAARPQPTPARPVTREELPVGTVANDVEPAGPRPPRPGTRDELPGGRATSDVEPAGPRPPRPVEREDLPAGRAANDTDLPIRPVEAAELPPARIANENADVVAMYGTGPVVARAVPNVVGNQPTVAAAAKRPPTPPAPSPTPAVVPGTAGPGPGPGRRGRGAPTPPGTPGTPAQQYRDNLVKRFPHLAGAELRPERRPVGVPGIWEEATFTGSGRSTFKATLRADGKDIQLDDINQRGYVVDSKMRKIDVGRETPPEPTPDLVEELRGGAPPRRQYDAFSEADQTQLNRQLRFVEENGLEGVHWVTNSAELKAEIDHYVKTILPSDQAEKVVVELVER